MLWLAASALASAPPPLGEAEPLNMMAASAHGPLDPALSEAVKASKDRFGKEVDNRQVAARTNDRGGFSLQE